MINETALNSSLWDAARSDTLPSGKTAYGVRFTTDGERFALAKAIIPKGNTRAHVALISVQRTDFGLSWLSEWLNERHNAASCVVISGSASASLANAIRAAYGGAWAYRNGIIIPSSKDTMEAAETLSKALSGGVLTWSDTHGELRESAISSIKRAFTGGWEFSGENSAPVEACSLALWGCKTSRRDPSRRMRIG